MASMAQIHQHQQHQQGQGQNIQILSPSKMVGFSPKKRGRPRKHTSQHHHPNLQQIKQLQKMQQLEQQQHALFPPGVPLSAAALANLGKYL